MSNAGKGEYSYFLDHTLTNLLEKLGDNNARTRESAIDTCLMMADTGSIGGDEILK